MKTPLLWFFLGIFLFSGSCSKGPETPKGSSKIELGQTTIDSVSGTSLIVTSTLVKAGLNTIHDHGYCWNTLENPDISGSHHSLGPVTSASIFSYKITGLESQRKYYIKPYVSDNTNTIYGNQVEVMTTAFATPQVTTVNVSNITQTSAASGGNVTYDGGANVTVRGVCYSTTVNPTLANSHTTDGSGTGTFVSNLSGLTPNTLYYVRAYATNSIGTAYGNQVTFTSLANPVIPTVTTTSITNITPTIASSGGNVTSGGGATVTARGVCWSISSNPTTANSHTADGSGTGVFSSSLTGLTPNSLYYVRSYATNNIGTAYGNEVSFTTLVWSCGDSISINHVAGSVAPVTKTVTYGTVTNIPGETSKCWITSNLGADHQATAVNDATEASAGWYWQFNLKQGFKHDGTTRTPNTTWITSINENSDWISSNDPCTIEIGSGWRIPTYTEWSNVYASGGWTDWNGPWNAGLKMHAAGLLYYSDGSLRNRGSSGYSWFSTQNDATSGWYLFFYSSHSGIDYYSKADGFALRCVRDY